MQHVRIIYLTSRCNLHCPYCYESQGKKKREQIDITYEELDAALEKIVKEEPVGIITTLCLMGGEPFIAFDKIQYCYKKCVEIKKSTGKEISINVITNGTLIEQHINEIKEMVNGMDLYFRIDISYDGMNQYIRTGDSKDKDIVIHNFELLNKYNIPYGISYTVTSNNYKHDIFLKEMIEIIERFLKDTKDKEKTVIRVNFAYREIESDYMNTFKPEEYYKPIERHIQYIYEKYGISICQITCNWCRKCKKTLFNGKDYYIPEHTDTIREEMVTNKVFNHF